MSELFPDFPGVPLGTLPRTSTQLADHICGIKKRKPATWITTLFNQGIARDLCEVFHTQDITHPTFDDPVGSTG